MAPIRSIPVIGIAALNNCPLEMGEPRERYIGWHFAAIVERFSAAAGSGKAALEEEVQWLEHQVETSLSEIDWTNLVTAEEVESPNDTVVRRLALRSQEFSKLRETLLREVASSSEDMFEAGLWDDEGRTAGRRRHPQARGKGVGRRAHAHCAQTTGGEEAGFGFVPSAVGPTCHCAAPGKNSPIRTWRPPTLGKDVVRSAVNIVVEALKGRRAGANLLEVTTCGAIAPYRRILGGKLVALLMLSPQIGADYRRRYASPSIISSQMKNRRVIRDSALVYLGTTSLYVHGSSQYNRLRLPAGTIAPEQESICYNAIGQTSGFGTIQFSAETSKAIRRLPCE